MRPRPRTAAKTLWLFAVILIMSAVTGPGSLAGVSSLLVDSEPGEPIGGGEFNFYTPDDGTFSEGSSPPPPPPTLPEPVVHVVFSGFRVFWSLRFAAAPGETLTVGVYENAVPIFRRGPGQPGLGVSGNARGCVNTFGRFEVKQVGFDADDALTSFWATFEQNCAGFILRGEIRYNADVPVILNAPSHLNVLEGRDLSFGVEGVDTSGQPVALSETGLPPGATFNDAGDGTGRFDWTPGPGQAGLYWVATHGQSMAGDTDTVYTGVEALPDFDDFDHPVPFASLPLVSMVDNPEASRAADDPICLDPSWGTEWGTVWYAFTPDQDVRINASLMPQYLRVGEVRSSPGMIPPPPSVALSFYTGERGALEQLACNSGYARIDAVVGQTYYIMAGLPEPDRPLTLLAERLPPPPANDDFDAATIVGALPFSELLPTGGAIAERDDPGLCGEGPQVPNVWYAYTPTQDTRVTIDTAGSTYFASITAFSGWRGALVPVACDDSRLSFTADAGQTYHIMIAGSPSPLRSLLQVSFTGAPPLEIGVSLDPDGSFDPHSGAAIIHGTASCSRPARIVVNGTLQQGGEKVRGNYEALVDCAGETRWSAEVAADQSGGQHERFTGGPATAQFEAVGVPDDNPDDAAQDSDRADVKLSGSSPQRAQTGH